MDINGNRQVPGRLSIVYLQVVQSRRACPGLISVIITNGTMPVRAARVAGDGDRKLEWTLDTGHWTLLVAVVHESQQRTGDKVHGLGSK